MKPLPICFRNILIIQYYWLALGAVATCSCAACVSAWRLLSSLFSTLWRKGCETAMRNDTHVRQVGKRAPSPISLEHLPALAVILSSQCQLQWKSDRGLGVAESMKVSSGRKGQTSRRSSLVSSTCWKLLTAKGVGRVGGPVDRLTAPGTARAALLLVRRRRLRAPAGLLLALSLLLLLLLLARPALAAAAASRLPPP